MVKKNLCHFVLNLIINGLPSKHQFIKDMEQRPDNEVLNLIINGLPSKPIIREILCYRVYEGFKPYYKWITF